MPTQNTEALLPKTMLPSNENKSVINGDQIKNDLNDEEKSALNELDNALDFTSNADIRCGFSFCNWSCLQRFANQSTFILVYGFVGCVLSMTHAYFNGTITTMEKRFHLSSRNVGITQSGTDISQTLTSIFFIHYVRKKHRPRWMGFGVLTFAIFSLLMTTPHLFFGAGQDALQLTKEFGEARNENSSTTLKHFKNLCRLNVTLDDCKSEKSTESIAHAIWTLFAAHIISGVGYSLYYSLGYSYMDDNAEKAEMASMFSFSYFLNMLGPSCGYTLAAFCLRIYISPYLQPVITNTDPRWIGAWWLGWLVFSVLFVLLGCLLAMFPKELPSKFKQRTRDNALQQEMLLKGTAQQEKDASKTSSADSKSSSGELLATFKRIIKNKIFMCSTFSSVFYFFGYLPYWIFTPKYLEIQFRLSTAESNVYTGTVALVFSAIGVLVSGLVVRRTKPRAQYMAAWNATVGFLTVIGLLSYSLMGCPENEKSIYVEHPGNVLNTSVSCASACHCDYVPYAPVCGENNITYISACHAGCKSQRLSESGTKIFYDCGCISSFESSNSSIASTPVVVKSDFASVTDARHFIGGQAKPGFCPVNCYKYVLIFMIVMCSLKFIGATTRASYFLIQVRSVSSDDKAVAVAFSMVLMSLLTFVPSPIFFGWLLDQMCLVWGKTCTEKGNCWLYDAKTLRYALNFTASTFVGIGALCDCTSWFLVKDLKVFDDKTTELESQPPSKKEQK